MAKLSKHHTNWGEWENTWGHYRVHKTRLRDGTKPTAFEVVIINRQSTTMGWILFRPSKDEYRIYYNRGWINGTTYKNQTEAMSEAIRMYEDEETPETLIYG